MIMNNDVHVFGSERLGRKISGSGPEGEDKSSASPPGKKGSGRFWSFAYLKNKTLQKLSTII